MFNNDAFQFKEFIIVGRIRQFEALVEFEQLNRDRTNTISSSQWLRLHGPINSSDENSTYWWISEGSNLVLDMLEIGKGGSAGGYWGQVYFSPLMSFEAMEAEAQKRRVRVSEILHLGELRVSELPNDKLRLIFSVSGFRHPDLFWKWVVFFMEEIHRLGFIGDLPVKDALTELLEFKELTERQTFSDIFVNKKPQENIARAFLQNFLYRRTYREVPTRGGRTDILVFDQQGRHLYETKIWRGPENYHQGLRELGEYIIGESQDNELKNVFYVIFDGTRSQMARNYLQGSEKIELAHGLKIHVVIIHISPPQPSKVQ